MRSLRAMQKQNCSRIYRLIALCKVLKLFLVCKEKLTQYIVQYVCSNDARITIGRKTVIRLKSIKVAQSLNQ